MAWAVCKPKLGRWQSAKPYGKAKFEFFDHTRSSWASFSNNASTAASPMKQRSSVKSRPGNISATRSRRSLIGDFLSPKRAINSNGSIRHFHRDGVLDVHFVNPA